MKINRFHPARTTLIIALAAALGACGTTPRNPMLVEAETAYAKAAGDPQVVRSANTDLRRAQQALQKADAAATAGDDPAVVEHYAYLAKQRTAVALEASNINQSEQAVSRAQAERDRILIDARTNEADARNRDAIAARKLADERLAAAEQARQQEVEARKQAMAAEERAKALEAQLSDLKARKTERGMVLTLGDVLFDTGRATLKPGAMRTVDQLASFLEKNPARRVLVEGHTDSVGSAESNRVLSQQRADAVRMALADRRIASSRVDTHGMGEDYPVASNDSASGRQQNRRVEIVFSDDSGAIKARGN